MTTDSLPPFPDPTDPVWPALDRYLAGAASPDDLTQVSAWQSVDPARREALAQWARAWKVTTPVTLPSTGEARAVARRIVGADAAVTNEARQRSPIIRYQRSWSGFGVTGFVSAVLLLVAGVLFRDTTFRLRGASVTTHEYASAAGRQAFVTLAGGTHMVLAPETRARVTTSSSGTHVVEVDGEALFTVPHSKTTPFVVRVGDVETRVLGTTFDVRHYASDRTTRVAVTDGKVAVTRRMHRNQHVQQSPTREVILAKHMLATITDSHLDVITVRDTTAVTGWVNGHLVFNDTPIAEALGTLERWYGYHFVLADSALAKQHLNAVFDYRQAGDMFRALKALLDVTLTFDGKVVTMRSRESARSPFRNTIRDSIVHSTDGEVGR